MPPEKFQEYYSNLNHRVAGLVVSSTETNERIGGILAIEQLINFEGDDANQKTTRFAAYLDAALRSNDNEVLVYAARALGHLAVPGGAYTADLVDSEVKAALEWLQSDKPGQESRRFATVLIIRELAINSPTLLYAYVPQILDCIWSAIRDPKVLIRETAAEAVAQCFSVMSARDITVRNQWYSRMYTEAMHGLKVNSVEYIHGSLLVIKELVKSGGMFMEEHYREACDLVMHLKDHREPRIRSETVAMIPALAQFAPSEFSHDYLHRSMTFLQGQVKKDKERSAAFFAIGQVAKHVGNAISPYLNNIIISVREGLSIRALVTHAISIFTCYFLAEQRIGRARTRMALSLS